MKTLHTKRGLLLVTLLALAVPMQAQTARVQFVHASPDLSLNEVDLYVDGQLFVESLRYSGATPYLEVPTGEAVELAVVRQGHPLDGDAVIGTVNLQPGQYRYAVLHGMTDPTGWPAVEGRDITAGIAFGTGGTTSGHPNGFTTSQFHAMTDLESFDWRITASNQEIFRDVHYGTFSSPVSSTWAGTYTGYATPANAEWPRLLTENRANFSSARGENFLEVLIGVYSFNYLRRSAQFLWVHPDGEVELRPVENLPAEVQFLAASPDPDLESVDIWVDGFKVHAGLDQATCSEYLRMTAGIPVKVVVAPAGSASPDEAIWAETVTFGSRMDYQAVLAGFVNPEDVDNPHGYDLAAQLFLDDNGQAHWGSGVGWRLFHAVPDWGDLDFYIDENKQTRIIDNLTYGSFSQWFNPGAGSGTTQYSPVLTTGDTGETLADGESLYFTAPGGSAVTVVNGMDQLHQISVFYDDGTADLTALGPAGVAAETEASLPTQWRLRSNYPNPFNPATVIEVEVPIAGLARVEIFDALGRLVDVVHDGMLTPGVHEISWTPSDVVSGVYLYRLVAPGVTMTRAMVLHK